MKIENIIPAVGWLKGYKRANLGSDISAGFTVAVMLVPQGMAYAMLAGLPPVIGLYASTIPLIIYALFGTSRQLAVGPVAMISLLVSVAASGFAEPGSAEYIGIVLTLALMTGAIQFLFGLLRMGFLVNFMSHAVISGFTSAAAIVIGLSQLKHLLGIKLSRAHSIFDLLGETARRIGEIHPATLAVGGASIIVLAVLKKKLPRFPSPLLVVVLGTLAVVLFKLDRQGVAVVGEVAKGLPGISIPGVELDTLGKLLPVSLAIVFVGYMESIAVAQTIATRERYRINPDREFIGLGLANIAAAFFSGYPVTGGFSRTAVNYQAGARTGLASLVTSGGVLLTLMFFTPLFYYLPKAILAAIIIVAVYGLIDVNEAVRLFKLKKTDGWTLVLTFVCTLTLGIETGIIIGLVFSLLVFIWRSAHPHIATLGYVDRKHAFLNKHRFPEARTFEGIIIIRVDASMYFANTRFIENRLRECLAERSDICSVVIDLSGVNDIDAVALHSLEHLVEDYNERDVRFSFAGMKGPVRDLFNKAGWTKKFGEKIQYQSLFAVINDLGQKDIPEVPPNCPNPER